MPFRAVISLTASVFALIAVGLSSIHVGAMSIPASDVIREIFGTVTGNSVLTDRQHDVLMQIRLPRIVMAAVVGAMLAIAGAAYQAVFRNPLADPYLLGVSSGAGLAVTIVVVTAAAGTAGTMVPSGSGATPMILAGFVGGVLAVAVTYLVSGSVGIGRSPTVVILAGVAVAAFANAAQTFIQQRNIDTIPRVYSWMLGSLNGATWQLVLLAAVPVAVCVVALLASARVLDVMSIGDLEARTLGIHPGLVRIGVILAATLGTAAVVSVSGLIGFVGIIVPHALRLVVGPGHRLLMPLTVLWGATFLIAADTVGRTLMAPAELPVGVVTAAAGAPFFLFILHRFARRRAP